MAIQTSKNLIKKINLLLEQFKNNLLDHKFRKAFLRASDDFDSLNGVDTEGLDENNYGAVRAVVFDEIMEFTKARHESQWFIDIGSGKGRALLMAAQRPFPKVIGVEIQYKFCQIAKKNIELARTKIRGTEKIEIDCTDAFWWLQERWPAHNDLFLFLYSPFSETTFKNVKFPYETYFQLVRERAAKTDTKITLAFANPIPNLAKMLTECGFIKLSENQIKRNHTQALIFDWQLYELPQP